MKPRVALAHVAALARRALGASTPLVFARLSSTILTLALPLVLARVMTPAAYGTYKQFFLVAVTTLSVMQLGLSQSLYYFLPRRDDPTRAAFLPQSVLTLTLLGLVASGVVHALTPAIGRVMGDGTLIALRLPLASYTALMLASCALEPALTASGRITGSALCLVLSDAIRALALIVAATHFGPIALFWAAALVALLRVAALWILMALRVLPAGRPTLAAWRRQLVYALPFGGAMVLYIAQRYCSQYVVSARFDTPTFALFTIAAFHLPILTIVFTSASEVLMVRMAQSLPVDPRRTLKEWQDTVGKLAAVLFPVACGAWLIGGAVLPVLFTARYAAAVPLFLLTTCEIPIWIYPCDALLRSADDTGFMFRFNAVRILITVGFVRGGIELFGLGGAIVGGIASETIARAVFLARGRHFLSASWRAILHLDAIARVALVCVAAWVPARAAALLARGVVARIALPAFVFTTVYLALSVRIRASAGGLVVGAVVEGEPSTAS